MNINKQKVLNLELTLEAGGRKIPQNILQSTWLERQNMKNETIFELYTDDNKSKYSSNPMNILKSAKKKNKKKKWISTPRNKSQSLPLPLWLSIKGK